MPPTPGLGEILMIIILVGVVFLGEKVGAIGDAIGRARKEFKRAQTDDERIGVRDANTDRRA